MSFPDDKKSEYNEQIFEEITLKQKVLECREFYGCTFIKCDFSETLFKECKFNDCTFENCNLSLIKVNASTFSNTSFSNSKVLGVNWTEASWPKIKLNCPIQFLKCTINQSTLFGLNLREVNIKECIAKDVDFREADLTQADLRYTDFNDSLFMGTNLTGADLSHSKNYVINITLNRVKKTKFSLPEAMSLLYCLDIDLIE
jgi:fluoroquinolone resistance protein